MTLALVASLVAPGPAAALSCIRTTPTDAFQRADESPDRYVVVHGRLDFDQSRAPEGYDEDASDVTLPARLSGQALNRDGFTTPFDVSLDLTLQCAGPWCGTIARDVDQLLFVKVLERGYAIVENAQGQVIKRAEDTRPGERLSTRLAQGRLTVEVKRRYRR